MVSRNKKIITTIGILAFASATFVFLSKRDTGAGGKGLRRFKVESFEAGSGWGYRILENGKPLIVQHNVPGIAGNNGFKDKQSALKTARLVEQKLESGIFPPSVSSHELDSLGIKY
ncbi:DUF4907 domain-containing protein [Dyadobacter sp. CY326]|uniref:DUF4907 domain-containing protein n=1 Tax=Dyadobacter sp. CY326 TaxID=2907300 RepID=UPI001F181785|nr:DUF4907 domain-containing protein [Dyadobacter sp. CY326]MCE7064100.1 DUF4907 domain-containing protein [Dyadobacter sp. CY326]